MGHPGVERGIAVGGGIGIYVARQIQMTALPQLVAAFHSLVGMAAVFVAASALNAPEAFHIGFPGHIHTQSLIEMSLGLAIGAITFSGSLIAFAKLQGTMKGNPILFPRQHQLNLGLAILLFVLLLFAGTTFGVGTPELGLWLLLLVGWVTYWMVKRRR